jgi:hypothetical protein
MSPALLPAKATQVCTPQERWARAMALRRALGSVEGWSEEARFEVRERSAVLHADGVPTAEAERRAVEIVRDELLRRVP